MTTNLTFSFPCSIISLRVKSKINFPSVKNVDASFLLLISGNDDSDDINMLETKHKKISDDAVITLDFNSFYFMKGGVTPHAKVESNGRKQGNAAITRKSSLVRKIVNTILDPNLNAKH